MSAPNGGTARPDTAPRFEGFAIRMLNPGEQAKVRALIADELGGGWEIEPFGDAGTDFDATPAAPMLSVAEAWEKAYRLRSRPGVAYAEPLFTVSVVDPAAFEAAPPAAGELQPRGFGPEEALRALCLEPEPLPESADPEWSLKATHVFEAWEHHFPGPDLPGTGIVIGHPDTGYRRHPEIVDNLAIDLGRDFVDDDDDAEDELEEGTLLQPGHGTGTASVILSPRRGAAEPAVSGVAPGAKLIPIRTGRSVIILLNTRDLARAIEHATDHGAHVVSISMGGVLSWRLRQAVRYAQKRGVIVLAAAGNCSRFVVWPAAYDEVVAVAACNAARKIWRGSSRGGSVDVTAPGESVWRATVDRNGGGQPFGASRGSGTSFAVATMAGIAALWLARHGRSELVERYGEEKIGSVFMQVLPAGCDPVPGWEAGHFGAGLINADKLLDVALPDVVVPAAMALREHVPIDSGGLATFDHLFEQPMSERPAGARAADAMPRDDLLRSTLADLLQTSEAELPVRLRTIGQELAFYCAVDPALYRRFEAALGERQGRRAQPRGAVAEAAPSGNVEAVRDLLQARGVSGPLAATLQGGA